MCVILTQNQINFLILYCFIGGKLSKVSRLFLRQICYHLRQLPKWLIFSKFVIIKYQICIRSCYNNNIIIEVRVIDIGMASNYDYLFKFIIIGDSSVGKSCLLLRFTQNRFKQDHQPTLGVQFGSKNTIINDLTIKIQIWDTAGQESFKAITRSYYKGSIAAFLVYDVTKRDSFQNINRWLYQVKNHSHDKVEIVLVGNKIDLKDKRQVSYQEGQKFANQNGFMFFQTSAQTGQKVQDLFKVVGKKIVNKIQNKQINPDSQSSYGLRRGKKQTKKDPKQAQTLTSASQSGTTAANNSKCCGK